VLGCGGQNVSIAAAATRRVMINMKVFVVLR
jgi:hypothetical protein